MRLPEKYTADNDFIGTSWPRAGRNYGTFTMEVPARPIDGGPFWKRWQLAWAVFSGRADALFWINQ